MIRLHSRLGNQLEPLGFRGETRRFVPHLTLGRTGRGLRAAESTALTDELNKLGDYDAGAQLVGEVIVYASRLRREGPEYAVLARIAFGGAGC